jgi:hypothetical protein
MQHPKFISGEFDTNFIPKYFDGKNFTASTSDEVQVAAILAATIADQKSSLQKNSSPVKLKPENRSEWRRNRLSE